MTAKRRPRAKGWIPPPWYAKPALRLQFLREIGGLADVRVVHVPDYPGVFSVSFPLSPSGVPTRVVTISFMSHIPNVHVDGPTDSPHRYGKGSLCMWYPGDPRELRWMPADGAAVLITLIAAHLIKECYWRLTGEWIGPEKGHSLQDLDKQERLARA